MPAHGPPSHIDFCLHNTNNLESTSVPGHQINLKLVLSINLGAMCSSPSMCNTTTPPTNLIRIRDSFTQFKGTRIAGSRARSAGWHQSESPWIAHPRLDRLCLRVSDPRRLKTTCCRAWAGGDSCFSFRLTSTDLGFRNLESCWHRIALSTPTNHNVALSRV